MPTGWRPADVKERYPITIIEDVYGFERYTTPTSKLFNGYIIFQLLVTTFLLLFMFYNYSNSSFLELLGFGILVFLGIYGYTSLMDRSRYAVWIELFRSYGDWFGLDRYLEFGSVFIVIYFLCTAFGAIYFSYLEKPKLSINTYSH